MEVLFNIFLILHIAGGSVGLFTGTINLFRKKGGKKHRLIGKVFVYTMLVAGFSSFVLSILHPNYFLFMVGVFTVYLVGTGNRYVHLKMLGSTQKPLFLDWLLCLAMLLAGLLFIALGILFLTKLNYFGIVFMAFGAFGLLFVKADFENYQGKPKAKNYWLLAHLQRMTGAYIASLTAFLVVNAKYSPINLPSAFFWLLPTIILVPFIIRWSRKYEVKNKKIKGSSLK